MGSPLDAALAEMLMGSMGGSASMGPMGAGPSPSPSPEAGAQAQFAREATMLRQADPAALLKRITTLKQEAVAIINETGMSLPAVARSMAKILSGLDAAAKEAGTAAATASVVESSNPISHSALPPSTGMPGLIGGM